MNSPTPPPEIPHAEIVSAVLAEKPHFSNQFRRGELARAIRVFLIRLETVGRVNAEKK